jgi:sec-independent protein translocase protein TatA
MGSFSIWHWIVVVVLFLLLFGGHGRISELMADFAQGIKSFKNGMQDEQVPKGDPPRTTPRTIDHQPHTAADTSDDPEWRAETATKFESSTS